MNLTKRKVIISLVLLMLVGLLIAFCFWAATQKEANRNIIYTKEGIVVAVERASPISSFLGSPLQGARSMVIYFADGTKLGIGSSIDLEIGVKYRLTYNALGQFLNIEILETALR